ncbi:EndoU domain-containing protein, partial [Streptomyces sp. NRRL S-495]|uniref:EndoU domain-containing protein n=1 Tax=Streptomyces sp. NRRL S-495 TaxID=1609133 RepID=UPI0005F93963
MAHSSIEVNESTARFFTIITGMPWPEIREGDLREVRDAYEQLAKELPELRALIEKVAISCARQFKGQAAITFAYQMNSFIGRSSTGAKAGEDYVSAAAKTAKALADCAGDVANTVEYTKWMAIAQLVQLMVEIALAIFWAPFSFGTSLSGLVLKKLLTKAALTALMKYLLKTIAMHTFSGIVGGLLMDGIIQNLQIGQGNRKEIDKELQKQAVLFGVIGGILGGPLDLLGLGLGKLLGRLLGRSGGRLLADRLSDYLVDGELKSLKGTLKTAAEAAAKAGEKGPLGAVGKETSKGLADQALKKAEARAFARDLGSLMEASAEQLQAGFGKTTQGSLSSTFVKEMEKTFVKHLGEQLGKKEAGALGRELGEKFAEKWVGKAQQSVAARGAASEGLKDALGTVLKQEGNAGRTLTARQMDALGKHLPDLADGLTQGNKMFQLGLALGNYVQSGTQNVLSEGFYNLIFGENHEFTVTAGSFVGGMMTAMMGHVMHLGSAPLMHRYADWVQQTQFQAVKEGEGKYFPLYHPITFAAFASMASGKIVPIPVPRMGHPEAFEFAKSFRINSLEDVAKGMSHASGVDIKTPPADHEVAEWMQQLLPYVDFLAEERGDHSMSLLETLTRTVGGSTDTLVPVHDEPSARSEQGGKKGGEEKSGEEHGPATPVKVQSEDAPAVAPKPRTPDAEQKVAEQRTPERKPGEAPGQEPPRKSTPGRQRPVPPVSTESSGDGLTAPRNRTGGGDETVAPGATATANALGGAGRSTTSSASAGDRTAPNHAPEQDPKPPVAPQQTTSAASTLLGQDSTVTRDSDRTEAPAPPPRTGAFDLPSQPRTPGRDESDQPRTTGRDETDPLPPREQPLAPTVPVPLTNSLTELRPNPATRRVEPLAYLQIEGAPAPPPLRPYQVRRGRSLTGDPVTELVLRLHLDHTGVPQGQAGWVTVLRERVGLAVNAAYNGGHRLPDGSRLQVRVEFAESAAKADHTVKVHRDKVDQDEANWGLRADREVIGHELGRVLGLVEGPSELHRAPGADRTAVDWPRRLRTVGDTVDEAFAPEHASADHTPAPAPRITGEVRDTALYGQDGGSGTGGSLLRPSVDAAYAGQLRTNANDTVRLPAPDGSGAQPRTFFPRHWTVDHIVYAAEQAHLASRRSGTDDSSPVWTGEYAGVTITGTQRDGVITGFRPHHEQVDAPPPPYAPQRPLPPHRGDLPPLRDTVLDDTRPVERSAPTNPGRPDLPVGPQPGADGSTTADTAVHDTTTADTAPPQYPLSAWQSAGPGGSITDPLRPPRASGDLRQTVLTNGTVRVFSGQRSAGVEPGAPIEAFPSRWHRALGDTGTLYYPESWSAAAVAIHVDAAVRASPQRYPQPDGSILVVGQSDGVWIEAVFHPDGTLQSHRPSPWQTDAQHTEGAEVQVPELGHVRMGRVRTADGAEVLRVTARVRLVGDEQSGPAELEQARRTLEEDVAGYLADHQDFSDTRLDFRLEFTTDQDATEVRIGPGANLTVLGALPRLRDAAGSFDLGMVLERMPEQPPEAPWTVSGAALIDVPRQHFADAVWNRPTEGRNLPGEWTAEEARYAAHRIRATGRAVDAGPVPPEGTSAPQLHHGEFAGVKLTVRVEDGRITDFWGQPDQRMPHQLAAPVAEQRQVIGTREVVPPTDAFDRAMEARDTQGFEVTRIRLPDGDTESVITVRVRLDTTDLPLVELRTAERFGELLDRARAGVAATYDVGQRLPNGDRLRARIEFVNDPATAHHTVKIHPSSDRENHRAWGLNTKADVIAHEVGHLFGLPDEYREASWSSRPVYLDGGLMAARAREEGHGLIAVDQDHQSRGNYSVGPHQVLPARNLRQLGAVIDLAFGADRGPAPGATHPPRPQVNEDARRTALYGDGRGGGHLFPPPGSDRPRPERVAGSENRNGTFRVLDGPADEVATDHRATVNGRQAGDLATGRAPRTADFTTGRAPRTGDLGTAPDPVPRGGDRHRTMFPEHWSSDDAVYAAEQAYQHALRRGPEAFTEVAPGVRTFTGEYGGVRIEGRVENRTEFRPA